MSAGLRFALAGRAGRLLLDGLLATARFELVAGPDLRQRGRTGPPVLFMLWHGRLLPLTYIHRRQNIATLISQSEDGEYIARIVQDWGYHTARGSSSRAGEAGLRELLKAARGGRSLAITPDGPRGPRQKLKLGVVIAAQRTGLPVVPLTAGTDRGWWFEGWDRFLVPKPFAHIRVAYGEPRVIERTAGPAELEATAQALEEELNRLTALVDGVSARETAHA